jgi:hypothetical protein
MNNETADMIYKLESFAYTLEIDVGQLLDEYKSVYRERPLWRMIEDIQRQAMVYTNIIELLKSGKQAPEIRTTFEALNLVPPGMLPNPNEQLLLDRAFGKVAQYRKALVEVVKRFGGQLLNELGVELGLTISVGVDIGFPPSITIAVEHTAVTKTSTAF